MKTRIVYEQENGRLAVIYPRDFGNLKPAIAAVPPGVKYYVLTSRDLPKMDKLFFGAWELDHSNPHHIKVIINLEKAKVIKSRQIKESIAPRLAELNDELLSAFLEKKKLPQDLVDERARLKGLLDQVANATSVEELKEI